MSLYGLFLGIGILIGAIGMLFLLSILTIDIKEN